MYFFVWKHVLITICISKHFGQLKNIFYILYILLDKFKNNYYIYIYKSGSDIFRYPKYFGSDRVRFRVFGYQIFETIRISNQFWLKLVLFFGSVLVCFWTQIFCPTLYFYCDKILNENDDGSYWFLGMQ